MVSDSRGATLKRSAMPAQVVGLELDETLLMRAASWAWNAHLGEVVSFQKAELERIPLPDESFDALVSEFIVYPTPTPTQIGQREMARVLKRGGKMILTDVIVTQPVAQETRQALQKVGLDYLCEATQDDFRDWMTDAGLVEVEVLDLTPVVRTVWEMKWAHDPAPEHREGYEWLLEQGLGKVLFYVYVKGKKV